MKARLLLNALTIIGGVLLITIALLTAGCTPAGHTRKLERDVAHNGFEIAAAKGDVTKRARANAGDRREYSAAAAGGADNCCAQLPLRAGEGGLLLPAGEEDGRRANRRRGHVRDVLRQGRLLQRQRKLQTAAGLSRPPSPRPSPVEGEGEDDARRPPVVSMQTLTTDELLTAVGLAVALWAIVLAWKRTDREA